jgi:SSS family solute:Na+ symporter
MQAMNLFAVMMAWDYVVLGAYLVGITALGSLFMRGQHNTKDFFLAGRSMSWIPVAISVLATNFSAITLLGSPGYIVARDTIMILRYAWLLVMTPLTIWLFLRFYYRLEVVTVYQYIGRRFDQNLRFVSAGIFLLLRTCWMATAQYATGLALTRLVGLDLWVCVLLVGLLAAVYSSLGGIKAVIWTDVIQAFLLLGAMFLTIFICVYRIPDGVEGIWKIAEEEGKLRFFDPTLDITKTTTLGMFFGITFSVMASYGVDQVIVQRYFTVKNYKSMIRSAYTGMLATIPIAMLTAFIGLSVFAYFTSFPDRLPTGTQPDLWFPSFILSELPVGITGLVIAGLFAATMSSADSGINSLTAVFMEDFYRPLRKRLAAASGADEETARQQKDLRFARWFSFVFGAAATVTALFVNRIGTIVEITITLNGVIGGVLLGIFLAAILSTRTNARGALIGVVVGSSVVIYAAFHTPLNFFWYGGVGCLATLGSTVLTSYLFAAPDDDNVNGLTLARRNLTIKAQPDIGSKIS